MVLLSQITGLSPIIVLIVGILAVFIQDLSRENNRANRLYAIASLLASMLLSLYLSQMGDATTFGGGSFAFNTYTYFYGTVFSLSALLVVLASNRFLSSLESPFEFNVLVLVATLGMFLVAASTNLVSLFVAFEMATVATYGMTAYAKDKKTSAEAAIKFFVVGAVSAGIILYSISLIYMATGTIAITSFFTVAQGSTRLLSVAFILLIAGFGFKIAAVPFHMWLPDTYDGAPYPTTTYLASASKIMGFAALTKIFLVMGPAVEAQTALNWQIAFGVLSLLTMTLGNLAALVQTDIKRMLAYSSISQSGYIIMGLALGSAFSYTIILYFVLVYAISKIGSFIVAEFFDAQYGARSISDYSWLAKKSPFSAFSLTIFFLSLAGIPPLAVFVAKFFMFYAAVQVGGLWIGLAVAGVLNSALSLYYYARVIKNMYLGVEGVPQAAQFKITENKNYAIPVLIALALTVALGLAEGPIIQLARYAVASVSFLGMVHLIEALISTL
jgi:proton-translocating NADH-quinone oxidoreductase chain N